MEGVEANLDDAFYADDLAVELLGVRGDLADGGVDWGDCLSEGAGGEGGRSGDAQDGAQEVGQSALQRGGSG